MNNEASQGLQTAGGAEREARELRKLILAIAREAVELAIIRSDLTWDDAADITAKQIAIDAALAILGQAICDDQPTESAKKLMVFAARCANEARLEALEQAERPQAERVFNALADAHWLNKCTAAGSIEIIGIIERALKAAPLDPILPPVEAGAEKEKE